MYLLYYTKIDEVNKQQWLKMFWVKGRKTVRRSSMNQCSLSKFFNVAKIMALYRLLQILNY